MAGALDKYRVSVDPTNQQRFLGGFGDFVGDLIDYTPIGVAKGFFTGDSGSSLGSELGSWARGKLEGATDTIGLTNQGETEEAYSEAQKTLSGQQAAANAAYGQAADMIGANRAEIADIIGPETMEKYKSPSTSILTPSTSSTRVSRRRSRPWRDRAGLPAEVPHVRSRRKRPQRRANFTVTPSTA